MGMVIEECIYNGNFNGSDQYSIIQSYAESNFLLVGVGNKLKQRVHLCLKFY